MFFGLLVSNIAVRCSLQLGVVVASLQVLSSAQHSLLRWGEPILFVGLLLMVALAYKHNKWGCEDGEWE